MKIKQHYLLAMSFSKRLSVLRKERQFTQQVLADKVGIHVVQLRRYEAGDSQPTLEVIRKLAISLSVSADMLVFDKDERGPDDELKLQFEALQQFTPEEKEVAKAVLESLILKHDSSRFSRSA
jgi:transcriptional regulator with XRE-family HTH domain